MLIDCDTCSGRGVHCDDCVISVLLGAPPDQLDADEHVAFATLADAGLLPPLRLVPGPSATAPPDDGVARGIA